MIQRDKNAIIFACLIILAIFTFGREINWGINNYPTRAEVQSMIKGDTTSIFHINNAGRLQSCLYTLIMIELNEIEGLELKRELENHVKWMTAMEEQRQAMAREKFEGK